MAPSGIVRLRAGRERSLRKGHPWLFSGAVDRVEGTPGAGDTVEILDAAGVWLARGAYAPDSRIAVRVWTFDPHEPVDEAFLRRRLSAALARRRSLDEDPDVTAYREVNAESDLLPGLVVDRYGPQRVVQFLTPGAEHFRPVVVEALAQGEGIEGVYERSDADARGREGLALRTGVLWGRPPAGSVRIEEYGSSFWVDLEIGHKTGFYLDQRENRRWLCQGGLPGEVLDAFCYTGGFTVAALRAGASRVEAIDSSAAALDLARQNVALNALEGGRCSWVEGDVFRELRRLRDEGRSFDTILLDPPRLAPTAAQVHRATRAYKDLNLLAIKLLRPGGRLWTFSCSSGVTPGLFEQIVAGAAQDAGVHLVMEAWLSQPADHPVGVHFPEGRYLKGLICRKGEAGWYPVPTRRESEIRTIESGRSTWSQTPSDA